jgi:hypothetical protein
MDMVSDGSIDTCCGSPAAAPVCYSGAEQGIVSERRKIISSGKAFRFSFTTCLK